MQRTVAAALSVAVGILLTFTLASAQSVTPFDPNSGCTLGHDATYIVCRDGRIFSIDGRQIAGPGSDGGGSSWPPSNWIAYPRLGRTPDGQPCVTTGYHAPGESPSDEAPSVIPSEDRTPGLDPFSIYYQTYSPCPAQPDAPGQAEDPALIAARYWEQIPLPKPKPYIAPGWAITGKLAYLETNSETQHTYTNDTPVGSLEIVATGRYEVDWGDEEKSGPYSVEGKAWPDGQITHDYVWAKTYDIVVTERWTATWRLGGKSGVLRELRTTGRIDDFVARQIQAVIRS